MPKQCWAPKFTSLNAVLPSERPASYCKGHGVHVRPAPLINFPTCLENGLPPTAGNMEFMFDLLDSSSFVLSLCTANQALLLHVGLLVDMMSRPLCMLPLGIM